MTEPTDFNGKIMAEFRANGGKVGGRYEGAPMILVHHAGARTGTKRVTPLVYQQVGKSFAIFASKAGAPDNPAWYHNLLAHPDTTVEVGTETIEVTARVAEPSEREVLWKRQKERFPNFAEYEVKAAPRTIPVVVLDPA
jgi:deazaflavin-dependent oxidoreductase (nitroreductase family)